MLEKLVRNRNWSRRVAPAIIVLCLSGCSEGVLNPHGPVGDAERTILYNSLGIMLAIVIPTILATLCVAWWYRSSNKRAHYLPDWEYSGRIEMVVWSIPAMVILLLGGIAWVGSHDLDPPKALVAEAEAVDVEVVSLDWKWLFIYPKLGIASVNHLVVPAGVPVSFRLTSETVMNSFFIPELGSQIYTMHGMVSRLNLQADAGKYPGMSAQFSGDGFSGMKFVVESVGQDQFAQWIETAKADGAVLDQTSYAQLAQPSKNVAPKTYGAVADGLFETILMKQGE
jgi:cytochrome o ubiquinol oxidase subunit 2